jgi:hypothetical protein
MSGPIVSALALEGADGQYVDLMIDGRRHVATADGLVGMKTRERVRSRPGRHGVINTSRYRDAEPVVIVGELFGDDPDDAWAEYNAIATACAAAVDTDRQLRWSGGTVLDLVEQRVRVSALSPPLEVARDVIRYQLTLRPADPRSFAQDLSIVAGGMVSGAIGGKVYPYTYPRQYVDPEGSDAVFTVAGTDTTPPILRVYGLASAPRVILVSTGEEIRLTDAVTAGSYVDIDVDAREVRLEDGTVRNDLYDFAESTWFELPPGPQTVRLLTASSDDETHVEVRYRAAYA